MTPTQKLIEAAEDALRALNTPHVHLTQGGRITAALEMAVAAAKQEQQADPLDPWLAKIMRHMTDAELERLKELAGIVLSESKAEPVLTVEREPDYWNGGHHHEGYKSWVNPTKVWSLPIGTKLYTHQPAPEVPSVQRALDALETLQLDKHIPPAVRADMFACVRSALASSPPAQTKENK